MRIGIFTECYHPTLNGVVVSIDTFKEELEKQGHKYFIFTSNTLGYKEKNPGQVFRYPSLPWPKDYPLAFPSLAPSQTAQIQKLKLDIIHTQHMFALGMLGLKIGRQLDIPIVHTYHTLISEYAHYVPLIPNSLVRRYIIKKTNSYCDSCDQIVTPSPSMKKILRSYGVKASIEAIPTGVKMENFSHPFHKETLKAKWHIPEGKKILLYVSRIAREKNLDFLFEAIKLFAKKRNDFHLLMVGGGPELKYYKDKVEEWELSSRVTLTGQQDKEKANRFFGAADIFVFPSVTETQGIVITEAMAAGTPAVAVNVMGPSDIIQDGIDGYLVPLKVNEFSCRIEKLLDDEELRKKFGKKARENAEKFSARNCALKMEKLYEKTISYRS